MCSSNVPMRQQHSTARNRKNQPATSMRSDEAHTRAVFNIIYYTVGPTDAWRMSEYLYVREFFECACMWQQQQQDADADEFDFFAFACVCRIPHESNAHVQDDNNNEMGAIKFFSQTFFDIVICRARSVDAHAHAYNIYLTNLRRLRTYLPFFSSCLLSFVLFSSLARSLRGPLMRARADVDWNIAEACVNVCQCCMREEFAGGWIWTSVCISGLCVACDYANDIVQSRGRRQTEKIHSKTQISHRLSKQNITQHKSASEHAMQIISFAFRQRKRKSTPFFLYCAIVPHRRRRRCRCLRSVSSAQTSPIVSHTLTIFYFFVI